MDRIGVCLSLPKGYIHVYDHNIQTSSPLKPLGQSKPNFMWSIVMGNECLYNLKNLLQNQKAYDFETWHEASGNGALQSLYKA